MFFLFVVQANEFSCVCVCVCVLCVVVMIVREGSGERRVSGEESWG